MDIILRNWTKNDIDEIAIIEKDCMTLPWTQKMLAEEYDNPYFYCIVAQKEDEIAGYINYHHTCDQYHIANMAVKQCYRREGIASMLLESVINRAKSQGITGITLEVGAENTAAINLYNKYGFKTEGIRKNYYKTQHAYIMWKYL